MTAMPSSRATVLVIVAVLTLLLAGCNPFVSHRSLGVSATDVAEIEFYDYTWGVDARTIDRLTIVNDRANREVIDDLLRMFTDMPTTAVSAGARDDAVGAQALGVRYTLEDGSNVEVTRVLIERYDIIVIWPDGTASHTEWGSPDTFDYYSEFGTVEQVDASERPQAELPR